MPTKQTLITQSLSYSINNTPLIEDVSLEFSSGLLHAILGPNGSGKSTLLKTLAGIWKQTRGNILWNNQSLMKENRQTISRTISIVPQNPQIHFDFLVKDIVAMGRYSHHSKYWTDAHKDLLEQALTLVDAWHLRAKRVTCLSQGERQRVYIARALMTEAPILLFDEPTASLDIRHQIEIWQLLQSLAIQGKIVIVSTHDIAHASQYCQQLAVLNHGRCIASGQFHEVMTAELFKNVFGIRWLDYFSKNDLFI